MIEAPPSTSAVAHAAAAEAAEAASNNNNNSNDLHFPPPVFEGSEKRLEIDFYAPDPASAPARGLRAIPRADLDALLADASCCVVSVTSNDRTDSYVLSESSLFVSDRRLVLKTCGTTRLLEAIPRALEAARERSALLPCRVKYSRASFLFPDAQPAPHHDFAAETAKLRQHFGHLTASGSGVINGINGGKGGGNNSNGGGGGGGGGAYVLGDALSGLQWHVFVADASAAAAAAEAAAALLAAEKADAAAAAAAVSSPSSSADAAAALLLSGAPSKLLAAAAGGAANATAAALAGRARRGGAGSGPALLRGASAAAAAHAAAAAAASSSPPCSPPPFPRLPPSSSPTYTLEVCMMGLDPVRAALFSRGSGKGGGGDGDDEGENFAGASAVTAASGLRALLPSALVDDFVFDPCGYSMNALDGQAFATVHVTPEEACSYASLELCGFCPEALCPSAVVARAAAIFGPRRMAVAMSVDADVAFCPWLLSSLAFPSGYGFDGAAAQDFGGRGRTAFYCLVKQEEEEEDEEEEDEESEVEVGGGAAALSGAAAAAAAPASASAVSAASSPKKVDADEEDEDEDDLSRLTTAAFVASPPPGSTACGVAVKAAAAAAVKAAAKAAAADDDDDSSPPPTTAAPAAAPPSAASSPLSPLSRPATGDSDDNDGGGEELVAAAASDAEAPLAVAASAAAPHSPRCPLRLSPSLFSNTSSLAAALTGGSGSGSGSGDDGEGVAAAAAARSSVEAAAALLAAAALDRGGGGGSSDEEQLLEKASASLQQQLPSPPRPARTPSPVAQAPPPPRAPTPAAAAAASGGTSVASAAASAVVAAKKKKKTLPSVPFAPSSSRPSHHPPRPFLPRCASAAALATLLEPRAPAAAGGASAALVPALGGVGVGGGASTAAASAALATKADSGATPIRRPPAPAPLPAVLAASRAARLPRGDERSLHAALARAIEAHALEDNVYAVDLGAVARAHAAWGSAMPRVEPFYAVKCNPDPAIVATLAALGAGFDCASAAEVELVLSLGVGTHRVVFANACKRPADVRAAAASGVDLTTFDTPGELRKLAALHPTTRALLRLRADDPAARCQLGNKYGCEPGEAARALLVEARRLGVRVVGVSFHVGSGASDPAAFAAAIGLAREAFDDGLALGFEMDLLDIGGGFAAPTAIVGGEEEGEEMEEEGAVSSSDDDGDGDDGNSNRQRRQRRLPNHHQHHHHRHLTATASTTAAASDSAPPSLLEASLDPATGHTLVRALGLDLGPAPAAVNAALERHFPAGCGVRVIAEPGRYYAEGAATLACAVYGSRDGRSPPCECGCGVERKTRDYWITDGLYGSMNCVLYDHASLACKRLEFGSIGSSSSTTGKVLGAAGRPPAFDGDSSDDDDDEEEVGAESIAGSSSDDGGDNSGGGASTPPSSSAPVPPSTPPPPSSSSSSSSCRLVKSLPEGWLLSTVFGPTCDGLDTVLRDEPLPRLRAGRDWLAFSRMGAYTLAGASAFNGFDATAPAVVYVWSERG